MVLGEGGVRCNDVRPYPSQAGCITRPGPTGRRLGPGRCIGRASGLTRTTEKADSESDSDDS